ncbi:MAG: hypothetical protein HY322_08665 [Betaproteobacteria bacterium]|nr:hypothetical protein [Betaproteobacteria bacterium]
MRTKTDARRTQARALPHDDRADEVLEFVYNDEQEALCDDSIVLSHQRDMPGLQEYLQEMFELDSRTSGIRYH